MSCASVITWFSSLTFLGGLGNDMDSIEVRALKNSTVKETVNRASSGDNDKKRSHLLPPSATGDTEETGSAPFKVSMSKSRPASRRQSNVTGMLPFMFVSCLCVNLTS